MVWGKNTNTFISTCTLESFVSISIYVPSTESKGCHFISGFSFREFIVIDF